MTFDDLHHTLFVPLEDALARVKPALEIAEIAHIVSVANGVAEVAGFTDLRADELLRFAGGVMGIASNLSEDRAGVIVLGATASLRPGDPVRRTGHVVDVPVGAALIGRVVDGLGRPLDEAGPIKAEEYLPVEQPAPPIMHRAPVQVPLQTGIKAVDAAIPIGRGQRELILGDRQTGKTAIALDTILNQRGKDVICVYCSIGQRSAAVAEFLASLRRHGAMEYCVAVVASGDEAPGVQYIAPYAATSMAEYFMEQGRDVLIVYDDLTRHARAYRELSLLMRRPPGREAYPGDIFYVHSRLLERATQLRGEYGGGSLTALPIAETQSQNISAYIPTNLISITDGQIILSPQLFRKGTLPAVDVGRSVSRVGGKAQLPCYRAVSGDLRLSYAQFEELEIFSRFGTRLDDASIAALERGRRVREVFQQFQFNPLPVPDQVAILLAASEGLLNTVPVEKVAEAERVIRGRLKEVPEIAARLESGAKLSDEDRAALVGIIEAVVAGMEGAS